MSNCENLVTDNSDTFSDEYLPIKSLQNASFPTGIGSFENRQPILQTTSHLLFSQPSLTLFGYINPLAKPQFNYLLDDGPSCVLRTQAFRKSWTNLSSFLERHIIQTVSPGIEKVIEFINKFACASFLELPTILSLAGSNIADHDFVFNILAKTCQKRLTRAKFAVLNTKRCASVGSAITQIYRQFAGLEEIEQQEVAAYATGVATDSDSDTESRNGNDNVEHLGEKDLSYIARIALSAKMRRTVTPEQLCEWYKEEKERQIKLENKAQQESIYNQELQELCDFRTPYLSTRKKIYNTKAMPLAAQYLNLPSKFPLVVLIEDAECFPPTVLGGILEIASHLRYDEGLPLTFVLGVSTSARFVESLCEPETYRKLYIQAVELFNSKNICEGFLNELIFDATLLPFSINSAAVKAIYDIFNQYNKCMASLVKAVYQICHDFYNEKLFSFLSRPLSDLCSDFTGSNCGIHLDRNCELSQESSTDISSRDVVDDKKYRLNEFCFNCPSAVSNLYQRLMLLSFGSQLTAEHFDYLLSKHQHLIGNNKEISNEIENDAMHNLHEEQFCVSYKWLNPHPLQAIMELSMDSLHDLECRNVLLCSQILPKAMIELIERQLGFFLGLRIIDQMNDQVDMSTKIKRITELMSKAEILQSELGARRRFVGISTQNTLRKKIYLAQRYFEQEIHTVCFTLKEKVSREGFGYLFALCNSIHKFVSHLFPFLSQLENFRFKLEKDEQEEKDMLDADDQAEVSNDFSDKKQVRQKNSETQRSKKLQHYKKLSSKVSLVADSFQSELQDLSYFSLLDALNSLIHTFIELKKSLSIDSLNSYISNNLSSLYQIVSTQQKKTLYQQRCASVGIASLSSTQKLSYSFPTEKGSDKKTAIEMLCEHVINWLSKCLTKLIIPLPHAHPLASDLILWGKSSSVGNWLESNLYPSSINKVITQMALCQQQKGRGRHPAFKCECCIDVISDDTSTKLGNDAPTELHSKKSEKLVNSLTPIELNHRYNTFPTMEDLTLMYRLYERTGRSIDLWDWFCAFCNELLKPHPCSLKLQNDSRSMLLRRPNILKHLRLRFGLAVGTLSVIFGIIKISSCTHLSEPNSKVYSDEDRENEFYGVDDSNLKLSNDCEQVITHDKATCKQMCYTAQMMKQELQGSTVKKLLWGKVWYCGEIIERELAKRHITERKPNTMKKDK